MTTTDLYIIMETKDLKRAKLNNFVTFTHSSKIISEPARSNNLSNREKRNLNFFRDF